MPVAATNKKNLSLNSVLAAAKKLNAEEIQLLKVKLFGDDIINELKAFESAMKKRKPVIKKSDDEIVSAVKKIRAKNAAK
jgi:dihydroxyacetone kinase